MSKLKELLDIKKLKKRSNDVVCVYGPPSYFEKKNKEESDKDETDSENLDIEEIYGPPYMLAGFDDELEYEKYVEELNSKQDSECHKLKNQIEEIINKVNAAKIALDFSFNQLDEDSFSRLINQDITIKKLTETSGNLYKYAKILEANVEMSLLKDHIEVVYGPAPYEDKEEVSIEKSGKGFVDKF